MGLKLPYSFFKVFVSFYTRNPYTFHHTELNPTSLRLKPAGWTSQRDRFYPQ